MAAAANDVFCAANVTTNARIRFSYQNIMECCSKCYAGFENGCFGGNFKEAMDYLRNVGAVIGGANGASYPSNCKNYKLKECILNPEYGTPNCDDASFDLTKAVDTCTRTCSSDTPYNLTKIKEVIRVGFISGSSYAEAMRKAISDNNILITEMVVFEDLYSYKNGDVYIHLYGRSVGTVVVNIIGYGTDDVTKQDFWLVRLPWGNNFGDKSVIKVQRGTNNCGIESNENSYYLTAV